jgi:hypothetical protein
VKKKDAPRSICKHPRANEIGFRASDRSIIWFCPDCPEGVLAREAVVRVKTGETSPGRRVDAVETRLPIFNERLNATTEISGSGESATGTSSPAKVSLPQSLEFNADELPF